MKESSDWTQLYCVWPHEGRGGQRRVKKNNPVWAYAPVCLSMYATCVWPSHFHAAADCWRQAYGANRERAAQSGTVLTHGHARTVARRLLLARPWPRELMMERAEFPNEIPGFYSAPVESFSGLFSLRGKVRRSVLVEGFALCGLPAMNVEYVFYCSVYWNSLFVRPWSSYIFILHALILRWFFVGTTGMAEAFF